MQLCKFLLVLSLLGTLMACATIPAQEMSDARQAIQAAEEAGASARSPRALDQARFLLEQAQIELADKDYAAARRTANASKDAAIQALQAADDAARTGATPPSETP